MKSQFNIKNLILLLTMLIGQMTFAQHHNHNQDAPSVHGMLLFGQEKIYLSHLPMFHNPHDYQVLLEVEIPESVKSKYQQSLKSDPQETVYTIVPESFVLPDLAKNPKPFKAQLFKGHFERGGTPMTHPIEFKISKVLYFKKFDPNGVKPELGKYIIIGNEAEQFLVHTVIAKPDFDYISKLKPMSAAAMKALSKANHINITVDSSNEEPLAAGTTYKAELENNQEVELEIEILKPLYLEFGDLSF